MNLHLPDQTYMLFKDSSASGQNTELLGLFEPQKYRLGNTDKGVATFPQKTAINQTAVPVFPDGFDPTQLMILVSWYSRTTKIKAYLRNTTNTAYPLGWYYSGPILESISLANQQ